MASMMVSELAAVTPYNLDNEHEKLTLSMEITQAGTMYINLDIVYDYTQDIDVYFDDYPPSESPTRD